MTKEAHLRFAEVLSRLGALCWYISVPITIIAVLRYDLDWFVIGALLKMLDFALDPLIDLNLESSK